MHQGRKTRLARLEEAHRPRQQKIFVLWPDGEHAPADRPPADQRRAEAEAYEAAHGPGSVACIQVVYESPSDKDPLA